MTVGKNRDKSYTKLFKTYFYTVQYKIVRYIQLFLVWVIEDTETKQDLIILGLIDTYISNL